MRNPFCVQGRAVVVTGGAGHLGRHICATLADLGAHVLCLSSRKGEFPPWDKERGSIQSFVCDVSDEVEFDDLVKRFAGEQGRLDGLVNGAVRAPRGIVLGMPREQFTAALDGVLTQYFTCSRIALRYMDDKASIVNLTSMWGLVSPDPRCYLDLGVEPSLAMPAAAGGILALTRYLAVLEAPRQIRVNALVPGWFPKKRGPDREDYIGQIVNRVPMGRIAQPQEIVGAVVFLISGASSYMTGQQVVIDGGYTIR